MLTTEVGVMQFPCISCGLCCRSLNLAIVDDYHHLDRGDGTCINLNLESNLCNIYHQRPNICRVGYAYFGDEVALENYFKLNTHACVKLMLKSGKVHLIDELNQLLTSLGKRTVGVAFHNEKKEDLRKEIELKD